MAPERWVDTSSTSPLNTGHQAVVLARSTGVDLVAGSGLAAALDGVDAVIDVTSSAHPGRPLRTRVGHSAPGSATPHPDRPLRTRIGHSAPGSATSHPDRPPRRRSGTPGMTRGGCQGAEVADRAAGVAASVAERPPAAGPPASTTLGPETNESPAWKRGFRSSVSTRVGEGGVEPPRPFGHTDLNRARLPFRHSPERPDEAITSPRANPNRHKPLGPPTRAGDP